MSQRRTVERETPTGSPSTNQTLLTLITIIETHHIQPLGDRQARGGTTTEIPEISPHQAVVLVTVMVMPTETVTILENGLPTPQIQTMIKPIVSTLVLHAYNIDV